MPDWKWYEDLPGAKDFTKIRIASKTSKMWERIKQLMGVK